MSISNIGGLFLAWLFILMGMGFGQLGTFIDIPSVQIVIVGTIAATFVAFPLENMKTIPALLKKAFGKTGLDPKESINTLAEFSDQARREGILALEDKAMKLDDQFLKKGIGLAVDGTEPEIIRDILKTEITFLEERHKRGSQIFEFMATIAPAMGMIGTLIGLILMLGNMDDVETIGPNMAVALITTLYGSLLANAVCTPIANILQQHSQKELLVKNLMLEGIMALQTGDNPRIVKQRLAAFLDPVSRTEVVGDEL
ncbi:MAG: motility protein A [Fibrobacterota bacterium]